LAIDDVSDDDDVVPPPFPWYTPALAGAAAGSTLALAPEGSRNGFSLFLFVRSVEVIIKYLNRNGKIPDIPHSDVLLCIISSSQILWAWIVKPETVETSYKKFLDFQVYIYIYIYIIYM
jgi:hypothetical protein